MSACEPLFIAIKKKLTQDIILDTCLRNFLVNTYNLSSDKEIKQFLKNEPDESISFIDLLFSPDIAFQIQIEPLISPKKFSDEDVSQLIHQLVTSNLIANINFDFTTESLSIQIPSEIVSSFIHRLNLNYEIPQALQNILTDNNPLKWQTLVQLRNEKMNWTKEVTDFISHLLETFLKDDQLTEIMAYMLSLCSEINEQEKFLSGLKRKKRQLIQNLYRYNHGQALIEKHNMEFLLLSGNRSVHVDEKQTKKQILIIDKVLNELFGEKEFILPEQYAHHFY